MSELRQNPITGQWVLIAPDRAKRPREYRVTHHVPSIGDCPFCDQHEQKTPEEILARRPEGSAPNGPGWQVRVVPNKYPALHATALHAAGDAGTETSRPATGAHEVIIESPEHLTRTSELDDHQMSEVLGVYRDRYQSLQSEDAVRYAIVFKNVGPEAGATIEHTHSQLIGLPVVPAQIDQEITAAGAHYEQHGQCVYCEMLARELREGQRVVATTEHFVAFCPYASCYPYETWIMPRRHASQFATMDDAQRIDCAALLRAVLARIDETLDRPAYNYVVQSAPFDTRTEPYYHWRIAIMPRVATLAGFELGSGCAINPVAPERAAQSLQIHRNS